MKPKCSQDLPDLLRSSGAQRTYACGQSVFMSGTATHSVFFVVSGAVRLVRRGHTGEEVVLHQARAGEFFAEASLDSARYHCDAIVSLPTELLRVPAEVLRQRLEHDREFAWHWEAMLARQLRAARSSVERLSLRSAAERVRHLLACEGRGIACEVNLEGTFKDLAHELGLTHETLYRTLATMERKGIIERSGTTLRFVG